MALQTSGTITWDQIRYEFGGGYPIYASQYYRGGGLVPNIPANYGVPTSGTIATSHFYGATNATPPVIGSKSDVYYSTAGSTGSKIVSAASTLSVSGGTGSYTYSWSILSEYDSSAGGASTALSLSSTTVLNPTFTSTCSAGSGLIGSRSAVCRLVVTSGGLTDTFDMNVYLEYERT